MAQIKGEIIQVIGPVIDVSFEKYGDDLPKIHDALEIKRPDGSKLVVECQQRYLFFGARTVAAIFRQKLR